MKLVFAIIQNDDEKKLTRALVQKNIHVTRIATTGGFLRSGNATLMIGVEKERLEETLSIIREQSSRRKEYMVVPSSLPGYVDTSPTPVQVTLGGATVFVVDVEDSYKF